MVSKRQFFCLFAALMFGLSVQAQFEKYYDANGHVYHDLNLEIMDIAPFDFIIGGNFFTPNMSLYEPFLQRVDASGNVVFTKPLSANNLSNFRLFDMVTLQNDLIVVGSVEDSSGLRKMFAAKFDLASNTFVNAYYYDIISGSFPNEAFHVIYTEGDYDNDGLPDPGYVISGYNILPNQENDGILVRTDLNLQPLFATEISTMTSASPKITKATKVIDTYDGYLVLGSATYNATQTGIMAYKVNYDFTSAWNASYVLGNQYDVAADAYYDSAANTIYLLVNYSHTHMFGVTALDNATGNIISGQSWFATVSNNAAMDKYGFTLTTSLSNANNLVITGYDRNTILPGNPPQTTESNVVVYEFDKANGQLINSGIQYSVPNQELGTDPYNFWDNQMPLAYYPDISRNSTQAAGTPFNVKLGYIEDANTQVPDLAIFKVLSNNRNTCNNLALSYTPTQLSGQTAFNVSSAGGISITPHSFQIATASQPVNVMDCSSAAIEDDKIDLGEYYPNPVQNVLHLKMPEAESYIIKDISLRKVGNGKITGSSIDMSNLKKGVYMVEIRFKSGQIKHFRIIKS